MPSILCQLRALQVFLTSFSLKALSFEGVCGISEVARQEINDIAAMSCCNDKLLTLLMFVLL